MPSVVLLGTFDTKGPEYAFLRDRLEEYGCRVVLVDAGVGTARSVRPDVSGGDVAAAAGTEHAGWNGDGDRARAVRTMTEGAAVVVRRLWEDGRLDGIVAVGGSGGTTIGTTAMRALPTGVPKVMVSTVASGNIRPYVGATDITMMYSVVDLAGAIHGFAARILRNAAAAVAGMVTLPDVDLHEGGPLVATSMLGLTMGGVTGLQERLEELGYDVVVFHTTGAGGEALERLASENRFVAVADMTPTELADHLCQGVCSAGPDRLTAAGATGVPQVVSLGGMDMVNFGPPETVPTGYQERQLHSHSSTITLMRTTVEECAELGRMVADRLNGARGPVSLLLPVEGFSAASEPDGPLRHTEADQALVAELTRRLDPKVRIVRTELRLNDPAFGRVMADEVHRLRLQQTPTDVR